jgi:hypothetical protein
MKNIIQFIVIGLMFLLAVPTNTEAQTNNNPGNAKLYNSWIIPVKNYADSTAVVHYANRVDTIYAKHWRLGTAEFIRVGGAKRSSITVDVTDTMSVDVIVRARTRSAGYGAASAWATIVDDSLQNATSSSGLVKEFSLVDSDTDLFDNVDTELMIILTHNAWTGDTQGTAKRRVRLNWVQ